VPRSVDYPDTSELRRCGCCGRQLPAADVAELGQTPGVFICTRCALWAARRAGLVSALRGIPLRSLLPRIGRRRGGSMIRRTIPILHSTDLARTAAFYRSVGFHESARLTEYLVLRSGHAELHFRLAGVREPGQCLLQVADTRKLWKQLSDQGVPGVGPIQAQDHGLRESMLADPDGNQIRIGSPIVV
jgi:hypothetical protein